MNHKGTVTLETEQLILRRFKIEDAQAMFRNFFSDPEAVRYSRWQPHQSVEVTMGLITQYAAEYESMDCYNWAIVSRDAGEPIGRISVSHLDERVSTAEMSYFIGKAWWHRGYATEALSAVIKYLFEEAEMNRIYGRHDIANSNSGSVMKKCGMRFEGTLRQAGKNSNGFVDTCQYAILAEDYTGKPLKGRIICIYGTVCSGKTRYARQLAKERHAVVLNHDEITVPLFGIYPEGLETRNKVIREYFFQKALEIMETGTPVILDWGFWKRADRKEITDYFSQHGYRVEWHGIAITEKALLRNVQNRYAEMTDGREDVYPADENLLAKAADIIEPPAEDEMDVWIKVS